MLISIISNRIDLSSKKLSLDLKKILETKNLSFGLKKKYRLPVNLKYPRLIRLEKTKKRSLQLQLQTRLTTLRKLYSGYQNQAFEAQRVKKMKKKCEWELSTVICYNYNKKGHYANKCLNLSKN